MMLVNSLVQYIMKFLSGYLHEIAPHSLHITRQRLA